MFSSGDKGYSQDTPKVIVPRSNPEEAQLNKNMAMLRVSIENEYGILKNFFAHITFTRHMLLKRTRISAKIMCGVLFTNCYACLYQTQVSEYFYCNPPSIEFYLRRE